MRDQVIGVLIVAAVMALLLGLIMFLNVALEGYESEGFCSLSDGSCYPK